jgi:hypothetical protein
MRYLLLAVGAVFALTVVNAPLARVFDTYVDNNTNTDGSPKFSDPDEPLEALADGGSGRASAYNFKLSDLDLSSGRDQAEHTDHSTPWTPERIRLVFGPYAH